VSEPIDKARKVVTGAAALAAAVRVEINEEHDEVERVALCGIPVFRRDEETGRPRIFGIPFRRWIRGPRR
jgi:hypothetical protein